MVAGRPATPGPGRGAGTAAAPLQGGRRPTVAGAGVEVDALHPQAGDLVGGGAQESHAHAGRGVARQLAARDPQEGMLGSHEPLELVEAGGRQILEHGDIKL